MTPDATIYHCLGLAWGVVPCKIEPLQQTEDIFARVRDLLTRQRLADSGDVVIVTAGVPIGVSGNTNMIKAMLV
jgi:pyruvate kinase